MNINILKEKIIRMSDNIFRRIDKDNDDIIIMREIDVEDIEEK